MKLPPGRKVTSSIYSSINDSKTNQVGAHQQGAESTEGMGCRHQGPPCRHDQGAVLLFTPAWMSLEDRVQSRASRVREGKYC